MSEWKYLATLASFAGSANRIRRNFRRAPRRLEIVPLDGGGGGGRGERYRKQRKNHFSGREKGGVERGRDRGEGGGGRGGSASRQFEARILSACARLTASGTLPRFIERQSQQAQKLPSSTRFVAKRHPSPNSPSLSETRRRTDIASRRATIAAS